MHTLSIQTFSHPEASVLGTCLLFWSLQKCKGGILTDFPSLYQTEVCASGVNHTLAQAVQLKFASPWWGRCGWRHGWNVARWHRYIPQSLLLHDIF